MSFYEMAHRQISKLGLNRFKWFGEIRKRTIPILNDLSKPIKINDSFYMFTDNYDSLPCSQIGPTSRSRRSSSTRMQEREIRWRWTLALT